MSGFVERSDLELLAVGGNGFIEFSLLLQFQGEILVRSLVKGVNFELLAEGSNGVIVLPEAGIGLPQIVPNIFLVRVLRVGTLVDGAFQQAGGGAEVSTLQGRSSGLAEFFGRAARLRCRCQC